MPNPIKYNSSTETNALNVGNFWIGTGDVDKGPTSTTGYYNGITPPPNGYTIYVHKLNQGPSIRIASDDSELIEITNHIAVTSYTTIIECFNYFEGQSDKMVTHQTMNFRITDGLVLDLDGNNIPSYPHNGTTWHDLSGESNNGTLTNGPTFNNNGWIDFDGTDDKISIPNPLSHQSNLNQEWTVMACVNVGSKTFQKLVGGLNNGVYVVYSADKTLLYLNGGVNDYYTYGGDLSDVGWVMATFRFRNSDGYRTIWKNGISITTSGPNNTSTPSGIGNTLYIGDGMDGSLSNILIYDRVISDTEVLQNYYQAPIVTDGLIRALDFSNLVSYEIGNSSGYDLTGNDTFDLFNTPTSVSDYGGGISCDNTDEFIALADTTPTDYVSVEVWFRRDNADSGENIIFNKENCWEMKESSGNLSWALMANNRSWFWYDSTANIAVGETVQFVLTYDGDYVKSYKNGEFIQSYTYPSGGVLSGQNSCYPKLNSRSCSRTTPSSLGNMTYFQFRIYDRALSPDEVSKNYHATKYKFNHA